MDQWERWRFDSEFGPVYVEVARATQLADSDYIDITSWTEADQM
jgi:hypothetical protein